MNEAIEHGKDSSVIDCNYINNNTCENIKLEINKKTKKYTKNNKSKKIDDYLWSLFSIVFTPEDINIINGSPGRKRDLIDKAIFFTDKNYINILKNYHKIISNKNINLKNNKLSEIDNWNILIAKYSTSIISMRNEYIGRINNIFIEKLNEFKLHFEITKYLNLSYDDLFEYFKSELENNLDREVKYKHSLIGAHRQIIDFKINKIDLRTYGSQGQKRLFILLFRSSQIIDFEKIHNTVPILLLDDMASELDCNNKNIFYEILDNFSGQTFITTTDRKLFSNAAKVSYFCVDNGKINSFSR